jgi:hypothetical protein
MLTFTSQLRYLRQAGWRFQVPRRSLRQGFRRLPNRRRPTPRQMGTCRLHERDPHHHEMGDLAVRSLPKSNTPSLIANPFFRAPYLVVLKDRGQTLRFYRPYQIRLRDDALREFLKVDGWKVSNPWSTAYAPGGDRYVLRLSHQIPNQQTHSFSTGNISWNSWLFGSLKYTTGSLSSPNGCSCSPLAVLRPSSSGSCMVNKRTKLRHPRFRNPPHALLLPTPKHPRAQGQALYRKQL